MDACTITPADLQQAADVVADSLLYVLTGGLLCGFLLSPHLIRMIVRGVYYFRHGGR